MIPNETSGYVINVHGREKAPGTESISHDGSSTRKVISTSVVKLAAIKAQVSGVSWVEKLVVPNGEYPLIKVLHKIPETSPV